MSASASEAVLERSSWVSISPRPNTWPWASIRPGSTVLPCMSMWRAFGALAATSARAADRDDRALVVERQRGELHQLVFRVERVAVGVVDDGVGVGRREGAKAGEDEQGTCGVGRIEDSPVGYGVRLPNATTRSVSERPCRLAGHARTHRRHAPVFVCASRVEQRCLALDAPAVAGDAAVVAHHAVAGNRHRHRIGRAGAGDRARALRQADPLGQLGIADRLALPGSRAGPATRAAGTRCRARRAAGRGRCAALRPSRPPAPPSARIGSAPTQLRLAGSGPAGRATSSSGSSPIRIAQMPLSVAATRIAPSEQAPMAKRIAGAAAAGAEALAASCPARRSTPA